MWNTRVASIYIYVYVLYMYVYIYVECAYSEYIVNFLSCFLSQNFILFLLFVYKTRELQTSSFFYNHNILTCNGCAAPINLFHSYNVNFLNVLNRRKLQKFYGVCCRLPPVPPPPPPHRKQNDWG